MRARYTPDSPIADPLTSAMGIVRGGEYNIVLERAKFLDRFRYKAQLMLWVQVAGQWFKIPYRNMRTFEGNWSVRPLQD